MNLGLSIKAICTFCSKTHNEVSKMFYSENKDIYICSSCVSKLHEHKTSEQASSIESPSQIAHILKEYVIGQDSAIQEFATVIYKHILVTIHGKSNLSKIRSNTIIIGPTGTGKTLMLDVASSIFNIVLLVVDVTHLTATGYVGDDVESMLGRLYKAADSDIKRAEAGIIFLDEIDKLSKQDGNSNMTKDIKGLAVQEELLRIIEGTKITISTDNKRMHAGKSITIDTNNMLFFAAGCFQKLSDKLNKINVYEQDSILNLDARDTRSSAVMLREELIEYGLSPEFSGRFPSVIFLKPLEIEHYIQIMKLKDSKLNKYIHLFNENDININIDDDVYQSIADNAKQIKLGVRGINYLIDKIFNALINNIEYYKNTKLINITKEYINLIVNEIHLDNQKIQEFTQ